MTNNELENFKKEFLDSPILSYMKEDLLPNDEILMVNITGSTLVGDDRPDSDIDIQVWTKHTTRYFNNYKAQYKTHSIHWWFNELCNDWTGQRDAFRYLNFTWVGWYSIKYLTEKFIIYLNPKYTDFWPLVQKHLQDFSNCGLSFLYQNNVNFLPILQTNGYVPKWHWVWCDHYISSNNITKTKKYHEDLGRYKKEKHLDDQTLYLGEYMRKGFELAQKECYKAPSVKWAHIILDFYEYLLEIEPELKADIL